MSKEEEQEEEKEEEEDIEHGTTQNPRLTRGKRTEGQYLADVSAERAVHARALDAEEDAQVHRGPVRIPRVAILGATQRKQSKR